MIDEETLKLHELQRPRSSPVETVTSQSENSDAEFVRWISSHRDSVKNIYSVLEAGEDAQLAAIPAFLKAQDEMVLTFIDNYEAERRKSLDRTTTSFEKVMTRVERLYDHTSERVSQMRRKARTLAAFADDLAASGRRKETQATNLLQALRRIEETRTKLLRRIQNPQWEVSHHFHMTALEHFRGNTQPHLMDIAVALPGQLRVCAMAKQTRLSNNDVFLTFQKVKEERDSFLQRLDEVNKQREILKNKLCDATRILEIMKSKMGPETELHLERFKGSKKSHRSRTKGYMQIKMRYFQKLKLGGRHPSLNFADDEQKDLESIISRNLSKPDILHHSETSTPPSSTSSAISTSSSSVPTRSKSTRSLLNGLSSTNNNNNNSDNNNNNTAVGNNDMEHKHSGKEPQSNDSKQPNNKGVDDGDLPQLEQNSSLNRRSSPSGSAAAAVGPTQSSSPPNLFDNLGVKSQDWADLGEIVGDIKGLNRTRERALGELEFALDCREHLKNELNDLRLAYDKKVDSRKKLCDNIEEVEEEGEKSNGVQSLNNNNNSTSSKKPHPLPSSSSSPAASPSVSHRSDDENSSVASSSTHSVSSFTQQCVDTQERLQKLRLQQQQPQQNTEKKSHITSPPTDFDSFVSVHLSPSSLLSNPLPSPSTSPSTSPSSPKQSTTSFLNGLTSRSRTVAVGIAGDAAAGSKAAGGDDGEMKRRRNSNSLSKSSSSSLPDLEIVDGDDDAVAAAAASDDINIASSKGLGLAGETVNSPVVVGISDLPTSSSSSPVTIPAQP